MKIKRDMEAFQPITITIDDPVQWDILKFSLWYFTLDAAVPSDKQDVARAMYEEIREFEKCQ